MKNQKGITLVALVITIIVLLILAGISIAALSGDNGLLTRASGAKAKNEIGSGKDQLSLVVSEAMSDYYEKKYVTQDSTLGTTTSKEYVMDVLNGSGKATVESAGVTLTVTETEITITSKSDTNVAEKATYGAEGQITDWTVVTP